MAPELASHRQVEKFKKRRGALSSKYDVRSFVTQLSEIRLLVFLIKTLLLCESKYREPDRGEHQPEKFRCFRERTPAGQTSRIKLLCTTKKKL